MVRQIKHMLREACCLDDAPDFDGAFILDQGPDGMEELRAELAVPPVLPGNQSNHRRHRLSRALGLFKDAEHAGQGLGAEAEGQAGAVCLSGLIKVLQTFRE